METGTVKFFNNTPNKLFGFIKADKGSDVFFHFNNGPEGNARMPQKDDRLIFDREQGARGPKAARWTFEGQELTVFVPSWNGTAPMLNETLRKNLEQFGLEDIVVIGKIKVRRGYSDQWTVEVGPMHLSQLCGSVWKTIDKQRGDSIELGIKVFQGDAQIGFIDSDRRFHYRAAANLRTALGWAIATDLGHDKVLSPLLDSATKGVETVIRKAPVDGDEKAILGFYTGAFSLQMKRTFVYQQTSRFADGHHGPMDLVWKIGTMAIHGRVLSYGHVFFAH